VPANTHRLALRERERERERESERERERERKKERGREVEWKGKKVACISQSKARHYSVERE
jgi:hypothetical protein